MIQPSKIVIKGFPVQSSTSFYNEEDLMSTTTIYVNDFPTFFSETPKFNLGGFYNEAKCKLRINIKPTNAAYFEIGAMNAYSSAHMRQKSNSKIGLYTDAYGSTRMKLYAYGVHKLKSRFYGRTHINQKVSGLTKIRINGFKIRQNKSYCIKYDKLLGYWDDFLIDEMDSLQNIELVGTIVG